MDTIAAARNLTGAQRKEIAFMITRARTGLVGEEPFFGTLALKLKVVEDMTCKTMWTDGIHLGYNPAFVKYECKIVTRVRGAICHEVMHCACGHHVRREDRNRKKWNQACDYAINPLVMQDHTLPEGVLYNKAYLGMSAEHIYSLLPDQPGGGNGKGKNGDSGDNFGPGGFGEVRDMPNPDDPGKPATPAQKAESKVDWEIAVRQAKTLATAAGQMPAGLSEIIRDILEPKVDWRTVLRRFIERLSRNDYSYYPPNRRYIAQGMYFPSVRNMEILNGMLWMDSSGSTYLDRKQFVGELNGILEQYATELLVGYCDAEVADEPELFTQEDLPLEAVDMKGGGGTQFSPAFDWIEENYMTERGSEPGFIIYLTDLECSDYPDNPPDCPVLWVKTPSGRGDNPPFGEVVHMGVE